MAEDVAVANGRDSVYQDDENKDENDFYLKYEPSDTLGVGLSSVVRRCLCKSNGVEYAVKIIDKTGEKEQLVRMEVHILSKLSSHPNIITLRDNYETSTNFFLVFDLATRGELFDFLTKSVTVPEAKTKLIMLKIIKAVSYMHSLNIVHRDLKPENILIGDDFEILVSDFGFANEITSGQLLKDVCGTPDYMAPEVLHCSMDDNHLGYGKPVDMWACGVILYTMLVGHSPFWHRKQSVMLWNIMDGKYSMSTPEWMDISEGAKDLVKKLLVLEPEKRLTADEALSHIWLISQCEEPVKKKKYSFKVVVLAVMSIKYVFVNSLKKSQPVSFKVVRDNPYQCKILRQVIDTCAFHLYDHWIQRSKVQDQNRAALFQNIYKKDSCDDFAST